MPNKSSIIQRRRTNTRPIINQLEQNNPYNESIRQTIWKKIKQPYLNSSNRRSNIENQLDEYNRRPNQPAMKGINELNQYTKSMYKQGVTLGGSKIKKTRRRKY